MQTQKIGIQKKDYNPREKGGTICENVIFTTILQQDFRNIPLHYLIDALHIVAVRHELYVVPTKLGIMCRNDHFKKATNIIENSILYN